MTKTIGSGKNINPDEPNVTLTYTEALTVPLSTFQEWMADVHFGEDEEAVKFLDNETAIIEWFVGQDQPRGALWELEVIGHEDNDWTFGVTVA